MSKCIEYFAETIKCRNKSKGYKCTSIGWCSQCGNLEYNEEVLVCILDFSKASFKSKNRINLELVGPKHSLYEDRILQLTIKVPDKFPQKPPIIKVDHKLYHLNVDQETNQIMLI